MPSEATLERNGKVAFEDALTLAGHGLYSHQLTGLAGLIVVAFGCIAFGTATIIPTSACELQTTVAQQGLISSGPLAGAIIGGYLGDKHGRRRTLLGALLSSAALNALASLSVNWVMLVVLQTAASFCAAGQFSLAVTYLSESVPAGKRNLSVLLVNSSFLLCQGLMAAVAIPIAPLEFSIYLPALNIYWNSWRTLVLLYSAPSLLAMLWLSCVMESPKYVFAQGREREALDIINAIHRCNRKKSAEQLNIKELLIDKHERSSPASSQGQIVPLFKPPLLKYTFILAALFSLQQHGAFTTWMPSIANQFVSVVQTGEGLNKSICGILSDSRNLPSDPDAAPCSLNLVTLLFILILGIAQTSTNVLLSMVVNRTGRRNMSMAVAAVAGAAGVLSALVPNAYASVALLFVFMTGVVSSGLYAAIAVALFPTHLRALAVALTMTAGRLVTFAGVQVLNLMLESNCDVGFYVFNSLFAASVLILAFLPDDRRLQKGHMKDLENC
ncbi:solute carrier family 22 member 11-like isoform X2 [Battus philenor]|uniref:solute carrier family 22 member 11-like isoform X2 n=1 Tax=Battus philenor TaxID=42288 RepID=UPI0035D0D54D